MAKWYDVVVLNAVCLFFIYLANLNKHRRLIFSDNVLGAWVIESFLSIFKVRLYISKLKRIVSPSSFV